MINIYKALRIKEYTLINLIIMADKLCLQMWTFQNQNQWHETTIVHGNCNITAACLRHEGYCECIEGFWLTSNACWLPDVGLIYICDSEPLIFALCMLHLVKYLRAISGGVGWEVQHVRRTLLFKLKLNVHIPLYPRYWPSAGTHHSCCHHFVFLPWHHSHAKC